MSLWTSAEIAAACAGTAIGEFAATGVTFDSREVEPGDLFIALKGEATDGHRYLGMARERGAAGLLVSEAVDGPAVRVADTMAALNALGGAARDRSNALRIGVTGSVGKTGVKEALKAALTRFAPDAVHASVKSYNNHTGVPLSLARMPAASRFGVFEMGMNHSGELAALTQLVRPHIAIVTWVASAHREFFATEADIARAKAEIFAGLPAGGTAIIPHDNPHAGLLADAAVAAGARVVRFGQTAGADVMAEQVALHPDCSCVTARIGDDRLTFKIGMAGRHWVNNALAVLAGVQAAGGDLALAGLALAELNGLPGRGRRLRVPAGNGQAIVIDEAYNANPASMAASLAVLRDVVPARAGRRIALLGSMKELGTLSAEFHAGIAPHIIDAQVALAVLVGAEMKPLAEALGRQTDVRHVATADAAMAEIGRSLAADDVLLAKGSNSIGLGRVVAALAAGEHMA
ncbi:UDP-N-acetylmuramoylalanyl-D-glutamyl-2, 6-diaminopimelate--D-alanyl-D-alanine ligase [Sandarakinorhabdus cyanobacteriorum]|uniref:UDP-N-acetylmuramoyl-tripeptide--D-alanyl-D-alanine ligase n=1 Tax=Sandarakinorhabdus cyanobacteriorum TaxID=1981098 RepID=A0A255YB61_9SPHN|nr:UDP-N-acetylmuramoyl-tripeptide--D-alanyl-D-alanine ligase [Sandarakinorhabdus cyanobacteriorum]OYQ25700.1 UDP-N-acetylmuramoylalanyl-D-glutamyl-2, 6-diaminopimelate--D-alanyl-D-alanine ligase [Sandarakinorhabdus cyanobacteriorum]